jgi:uncharacterized coiled-coil protein SlyX
LLILFASVEKRSLRAAPCYRSNSRPEHWTAAQVEDIELAAGPASMEAPMEARIARLESDIAHLRTDVADVKVDVRTLRDKIDALGERFDSKLDAMTQRFEALKDMLAATRQDVATMKERIAAEIATAKVWALVLYFALAAGMFGTMARGFGWL